jgi:hypothetical protein
VLRDGQCREQARLERFQIVPRESSLEASLIDGWSTLLLMMEDVQLGDVIELSYTTTTESSILPQRFQFFEAIPVGLPMAEMHLEVCFDNARPMQWKSSSEQWTPEIRQEGQLTWWHWQQKNLLDSKAEANLPDWFLAGHWLQLTDCQSWDELIAAYAGKWPVQDNQQALRELARQLAIGDEGGDDSIDKAIAFVQDGFRFVGGKNGFGDLVPSAPLEVARRRYGDCKDLAFLLAALLRAVGVPARPLLVHSQLKGRIGGLLPMMFFNHAIVEYEIDNDRRWVDPVRQLQGGGARRRPIASFGIGLPVEAGCHDLRDMPQQQRREEGGYKLQESFWLNTAGVWSILEVRLSASGAQAEILRNAFAHKPECIIADERMQFYGQLFPKIKRVGPIIRKDDRALNEFSLSETYEVAGALHPSGFENTVSFSYSSHLVQQILRQPLHEHRRYPCALPFPYSIEHIIDVDFSGLQTQPMAAYYKKHPLFLLSRKSRANYGFHATTFVLETYSDSILPEQFQDFRETIDEVWPETMLFVSLPEGVPGRRPKHLK